MYHSGQAVAAEMSDMATGSFRVACMIERYSSSSMNFKVQV